MEWNGVEWIHLAQDRGQYWTFVYGNTTFVVAELSRMSCKLATCTIDWIVCACLTQLYDFRDMYRIYYVKNSQMFRRLTVAIFRLRI